MKIFEELALKFKEGNWALDPELGLMDAILETHSCLIKEFEEEICKDESKSNFGRKDTPSVEQIVRAAIYKEMKGLRYRELDYAQEDSQDMRAVCENRSG
jgi:IS5 family transposase